MNINFFDWTFYQQKYNIKNVSPEKICGCGIMVARKLPKL